MSNTGVYKIKPNESKCEINRAAMFENPGDLEIFLS